MLALSIVIVFILLLMSLSHTKRFDPCIDNYINDWFFRMSQAVKRVAATSVNWQKLADRLTPQHVAELNRLKGQNSTFSAM